MGKIVKYCAPCDESFAEKFGFCPNCGQAMTAFEMSPVAQAAAVSEAATVPEEVKTEPVVEDSVIGQPIFKSSAPTYKKSEKLPVVETAAVAATQTPTFSAETETIADVETETGPIMPKTFAAAAGANGNGNGNGNHYQTATNDFRPVAATPADDEFHVTVIEEKNGKQRNGLLLASMILILTVVSASTVYSLFSKDLGVGAIGDEGLFALVVVETDPMELLEKPEPEKVGDEGGGGGGGGRKDDAPVSKGTLPPQLKERFITPSKEDISVTNPAIPITRATKGPNDIIPKDRSTRNGDPNSTNLNPSNGLGPDNLGMGQNGSGGFGNNGRDGMGSNGDGGIGNVPGNGYGNNPNGGDGGRTPPPPPPAPKAPVGVTTKVKILSKPKATYTNEGRQNNVTGVVRLRVVFTASGQIGSISPVSGLPYGLTEQAISAAKAIKFEPAMVNGVPKTTSVTMEYSFAIF